MKEQKTKITESDLAFALKEGRHWDRHSLADVWEQTRSVDMDVELTRSYLLMPMTPQLAAKVEKLQTRKRTSLTAWFARAVNHELAAAS